MNFFTNAMDLPSSNVTHVMVSTGRFTRAITYDIPSFMNMEWGGKQDTIVVVGDSKQEYQTNIVQALGTIQNVTNGLGLGFGFEVNESFNDGFDFSET